MSIFKDTITGPDIPNVDLRSIFACDWIMVNMLQNVSPRADVNLYKIYASEFHKPDAGISSSRLANMTTDKEELLKKFVLDVIQTRLINVVERWMSYEKDMEKFSGALKIPVVCKTTLDRLLTEKNDKLKQADLLKSLRLELSCNQDTYYGKHEPFPIPLVDFRSFCSIILNEIRAAENSSNKAEAINCCKTLLLLCLPKEICHNTKAIRELYEDHICWSRESTHMKRILRKVLPYCRLNLTHAVCLFSDSDVVLPTTRDYDYYTDTTIFLSTQLFLDTLLTDRRMRRYD